MIGLNPTIRSAQSVKPLPKELITVDAIMDSLIQQFGKIEDYTVKVKISVKMPRFRMPKKTIKLYFKQPDRVKVEAEGFAVVPKTGLGTSPVKMIEKLMAMRVIGTDTLRGYSCLVIEGTAESDSGGAEAWTFGQKGSQRVRVRLWVDVTRWIIPQVETFFDTVRVMSIRSFYKEFEEGIQLPTLTEIDFHLGGEYLATLGEHPGPFGEFQDREGMEKFSGSVRMEFTGYKINRGLKDRIFKNTIF